MKKLFGLLAVCALTLASCSDKPEPEPQPQPGPISDPVIILDKESIDAPAEGGTFSVNYTMENIPEGATPNVEKDVEWIKDVTVEDGVISFVVVANEDLESRSTTLDVRYVGYVGGLITVTQAAKEEEPQPEMPTIALEVSDIT